ncbi:hypothetical protein [Alteriqipengyuania lutimaris]|uniref:hypothetical protein n=1 Tax=Alteriqipengyuania lutimaris TaxID=1538146 RepID=UPI0017BC7A3F|nr:hypothetical protein [Alteriqipengyuania lutimaris]MBB3035508.1 hypothetical protein [Alteriqipengyuania lutimaris]
MRKLQWTTVSMAALLLAACNGQDAEPAESDTSGDTAIEQPAPTQTPDTAANDVPSSPTPPDAEYANSRPPLDNSRAQATEGSCLAELGREEAEALSEQCYTMSPATRPPCNIQNSCERIREELKRGCEFGDISRNPDYCEGL